MKIILPVVDKDSEIVSKNFGRSPYFLLIDGDKFTYLENKNKNLQNGAGVKSAELIIGLDPEVVIAPKLGEKPNKLFKLTNIKIFRSNSSNIYENLELLNENKLDRL